MHSDRNDSRDRNEVVALIQDFLGADGQALSVVSRQLPPFDHVNLQTAVDAWTTQPNRSVAVHGITIPPHHGSVSLQQLVTGEGIPPLRLSAPPLVDLPNGPGSTLACMIPATSADRRVRPVSPVWPHSRGGGSSRVSPALADPRPRPGTG